MKIGISLYVFMEGTSIFDTIPACEQLREPRLMDYISDIRIMCTSKKITNISWIMLQQNTADNVTCFYASDILQKSMSTLCQKFIIQQLILKSGKALVNDHTFSKY